MRVVRRQPVPRQGRVPRHVQLLLGRAEARAPAHDARPLAPLRSDGVGDHGDEDVPELLRAEEGGGAEGGRGVHEDEDRLLGGVDLTHFGLYLRERPLRVKVHSHGQVRHERPLKDVPGRDGHLVVELGRALPGAEDAELVAEEGEAKGEAGEGEAGGEDTDVQQAREQGLDVVGVPLGEVPLARVVELVVLSLRGRNHELGQDQPVEEQGGIYDLTDGQGDVREDGGLDLGHELSVEVEELGQAEEAGPDLRPLASEEEQDGGVEDTGGRELRHEGVLLVRVRQRELDVLAPVLAEHLQEAVDHGDGVTGDAGVVPLLVHPHEEGEGAEDKGEADEVPYDFPHPPVPDAHGHVLVDQVTGLAALLDLGTLAGGPLDLVRLDAGSVESELGVEGDEHSASHLGLVAHLEVVDPRVQVVELRKEELGRDAAAAE
mmetsp:Transcript_25022/g.51968  ORF Transcript_25022/g.51968 Transcript_25022/m.51968 type:complete len:433 (-) Transcript_25022:4739-6037(-)